MVELSYGKADRTHNFGGNTVTWNAVEFWAETSPFMNFTDLGTDHVRALHSK